MFVAEEGTVVAVMTLMSDPVVVAEVLLLSFLGIVVVVVLLMAEDFHKL